MNPRVFRSLEAARAAFGPCALAIGNFDGVHIGHHALLSRVASFASENRLVPGVLTFDPHPTAIVAPERVPQFICSLEERLRLLGEAGAAHILVLPFTEETARLSPQAFVAQILLSALKTKAVFVGENFRFGHRQAGTTKSLQDLGRQFGFEAEVVESVTLRGEIVSSSSIRQYLTTGNVSHAGRLLGRCFSVEGLVVSGQGIGSKQTVPTLNLEPGPERLIPRGVYVSETVEPSTNRRWPSITNAGLRPTFGGDHLTVESFLLAPFDGATPEHIRVSFRRFVRAERQFPSPEALKAQILKDVGRALAYWRRWEKAKAALKRRAG